jgi:hypothetical protein
MWFLLIILSWFNFGHTNIQPQSCIDGLRQQVQDNDRPAQERKRTWQVLRKVD